LKPYDRALLRRKFAEVVDGYLNSIPTNSEAMISNEFEFPLILIAFVAKGNNGGSFTSVTTKVVPEYESQNSFNTSEHLTKNKCHVFNELKNGFERCLNSIADNKKQHAIKLSRQFGKKQEN
jgi:hypothetical protein